MTDSLDIVFDQPSLDDTQDHPEIELCCDSLDEGSMILQHHERKKNLVVKRKVHVDQNGKIVSYKPL